MLNPFTSADCGQDPVLFIHAIFGNQPQDGMTNYFIGSIAIVPFSGGIPAGDDAIKRLTDNGILGGRDNGCRVLIGGVFLRVLRHAPSRLYRGSYRGSIVILARFPRITTMHSPLT